MECRKENTARDRILTEFIKETGLDETVASTYLESEGWNLQRARVDLQRIKIDEESRKQTFMPEKKSNSRQHPDLAKVGRGLSMANSEIVANARENIRRMKSTTDSSIDLNDIPHASFLLPDITQYDADFVDFLKKDLIDKQSWKALTDSGHLNWWAYIGACRKLFPLSTVGDGNCLLHSASLGMWGFHDRLLTLRKSLYHYMTESDAIHTLKRRWKYAQWKINMECGGLTFTNEEWEDEWKELLRLASDSPRHPKEKKRVRRISRQISITNEFTGSAELKPRSDSVDSDCFESLEEFHVFCLAQVLRRPIIVISDTILKNYDGEALSPINFGGIYLPVECEPSNCYKFPLVLAYDSGHFCACVPAEGEDDTSQSKLSSTVPLVNAQNKLLHLRFIVDPGEEWYQINDDDKKPVIEEPTDEKRMLFMQKYMSVVRVQVKAEGSRTTAVEKSEKSRSLTLRIKEKAQTGKKSPLLGRALDKISSFLPNNGSLPTSLYAANLDTHNLPKYHEEMIANYMNSSQKRFKMNRAKLLQTQTKCQSPGCQRFGSEETHYLCSTCYDVERNINIPTTHRYEILKGPHNTATGQISGYVNNSTGNSPHAQLCISAGCKFYGSQQRNGYCSSCFNIRQKQEVLY